MKKRRMLLPMVITMFVVAAAQVQMVLANDYDDASRLSPQLNATAVPDRVTLTWSDDPLVSMTIAWRTSTDVKRCTLEYTDAGIVHPISVDVKPEPFRYLVVVARHCNT